MKPKLLLLTLTWQTLSTLTFAWKQMSYVFLTRFSDTLFTKTLLLLHISLLKCFIYRKVNTSKILHDTTFPVMLTKNYVKKISVHFYIKRKLSSSSYLLPAQKKNLAIRKVMLTELIQNISHACWKNNLTIITRKIRKINICKIRVRIFCSFLHINFFSCQNIARKVNQTTRRWLVS